MKKTFRFALHAAALGSVLLAGCAGTPQAPDNAWTGYQQWHQAARQQATAGALSWSSYYQQSFDRLTVLPASFEQDARLEATVNLLSLARKRDAGEIDAHAFEQQRSALEAALQQRLQR